MLQKFNFKLLTRQMTELGSHSLSSQWISALASEKLRTPLVQHTTNTTGDVETWFSHLNQSIISSEFLGTKTVCF